MTQKLSYTVENTTNYTMFTYVKGNRDISKSHVKWLVQEIGKDANVLRYNPILVNDKYKIIDGQHRYEAAKQLEVPLWYIVEPGLTLKDAQALNQGSKPWSPVSYARSHARLGNDNYQVYLDFREEYGFNHDVLMKYLSLSNPITGDMFRDGRFRVEDIQESRQLSDDLCAFAGVWEAVQGKQRAYIRTFALAYKEFWELPDFSQERLVRKLRANPSFKLDYGTVPDTVAALKELNSQVG